MDDSHATELDLKGEKKKWFKSPELISITLKVVSSKEIETVPLTPYGTTFKCHDNLNQPIYCYKNNFATDVEIAYDFNIFFKQEI